MPQRRNPNAAHKRRRRPPPFFPVVVRRRKDGWTISSQCRFLAELYRTGRVDLAARSVGMSRMSAYRLRRREGAESFAHAWDAVLTPPGTGCRAVPRTEWRKVTQAALLERALIGRLHPVIYRGRLVGVRRKPQNTALFRLLRRGDTNGDRMRRHAVDAPRKVLQTGGVGAPSGPRITPPATPAPRNPARLPPRPHSDCRRPPASAW